MKRRIKSQKFYLNKIIKIKNLIKKVVNYRRKKIIFTNNVI